MSHCLGIEASNLSPVKGKQMHQEFTPPPLLIKAKQMKWHQTPWLD